MKDRHGGFEFRRIEPTDPDHLTALRLALRNDPLGAGDSIQTVADLLAAAGRGCCSLNLVFGAYDGDRLENAVVAVEFPGSAAHILFPRLPATAPGFCTTLDLLQGVLEAAWEGSLKLLQSLIPPDADHAARNLRGAGFRFLTQLVYLVRADVSPGPMPGIARDLSWISYAPHHEELFCRALEQTYVESLDCPELTELRTASEVLAGHRATGVFDATLWWVAMRASGPVGIALLNPLPAQPIMEIVYVGVADQARGTGVSDALLERMVAAAHRRHACHLTLAVDCRNAPARRMYQRWRFEPLTALDAWIATASQT